MSTAVSLGASQVEGLRVSREGAQDLMELPAIASGRAASPRAVSQDDSAFRSEGRGSPTATNVRHSAVPMRHILQEVVAKPRLIGSCISN